MSSTRKHSKIIIFTRNKGGQIRIIPIKDITRKELNCMVTELAITYGANTKKVSRTMAVGLAGYGSRLSGNQTGKAVTSTAPTNKSAAQ